VGFCALRLAMRAQVSVGCSGQPPAHRRFRRRSGGAAAETEPRGALPDGADYSTYRLRLAEVCRDLVASLGRPEGAGSVLWGCRDLVSVIFDYWWDVPPQYAALTGPAAVAVDWRSRLLLGDRPPVSSGLVDRDVATLCPDDVGRIGFAYFGGCREASAEFVVVWVHPSGRWFGAIFPDRVHVIRWGEMWRSCSCPPILARSPDSPFNHRCRLYHCLEYLSTLEIVDSLSVRAGGAAAEAPSRVLERREAAARELSEAREAAEGLGLTGAEILRPGAAGADEAGWNGPDFRVLFRHDCERHTGIPARGCSRQHGAWADSRPYRDRTSLPVHLLSTPAHYPRAERQLRADYEYQVQELCLFRRSTASPRHSAAASVSVELVQAAPLVGSDSAAARDAKSREWFWRCYHTPGSPQLECRDWEYRDWINFSDAPCANLLFAQEVYALERSWWRQQTRAVEQRDRSARLASRGQRRRLRRKGAGRRENADFGHKVGPRRPGVL